MVLMVVHWRQRMPFHVNNYVSMLINNTSYAKILNERDKSAIDIQQNECIFALMSLRFALMMVYFLVMNNKRFTMH